MNRRQLLMSNNWGSVYTPPRAGLAAQFDARFGITSSGGFASAWADQSGNGRSLLQATGANQPIHLPFAGTKYGWLPGVAGNYFSTPDSVAASITGDIDIRVKAALNDWTPGASSCLVAKADGSGGDWAFEFLVLTSGALFLRCSADGSTLTPVTSTASVSFTNGQIGHCRVTRSAATGYVNFYTSSDGVIWTLLGDADGVTPAGGIFNSTQPVRIGTEDSVSYYLSGQIYRAQIYNGIDGTLAVDCDPSRWSSGTTFTASTGETWTINSTGSKPAQIVDRSSLLFDGAAHYMKCNSFTLNQPETIYLVAKQVSWTLNDYLFDGNSAGGVLLSQRTSSPTLKAGAGSLSNDNSNLAVGATGVISVVFSGASSVLQVNQTTAVTGNFGANNAGGFTLGAIGDGSGSFANIQAYEALIYNVAHDAATRANVIRALMSKHGVA